MNRGVLNSMTDAERMLVAETERDAMSGLDEDELLDLQQRIRRARTKYVKNYRRAASAAVSQRGGRGASHARNERDRNKAEVFELALARVSRQVSAAARRSAAELKAERLSAARGSGSRPAGRQPSEDGRATGASQRRPATKTTGGVKKDASSRAQGARRQAKRDAR